LQCIRERKVASYLKLREDDRLLVSSVFGPEFGPNVSQSSARTRARPDLQLWSKVCFRNITAFGIKLEIVNEDMLVRICAEP